MKLGQKSASIIILSFFCTIYAPLFQKEGFLCAVLMHWNMRLQLLLQISK